MLNELSEQPQVYLPDDLLEAILRATPDTSQAIREIFDALVAQRQAMRDHLQNSDYLQAAADLPPLPASPTVAAVDGGLAIERSLGADMVLVAAVGVEGLMVEDRRHWSGMQHAHWQRVISHAGGEASQRFARGIMAALELEILANAPHDVIILDGSHVTPVIGLNSMLSLPDDNLARLAAGILIEHHTPQHLHYVMRQPHIIALVKYDASRDLSQTWLAEFTSPYDDRTVMTLLLEAGEYTRPVPVGQTPRSQENWEQLHITIASAAFPQRRAVQAELEQALQNVQARNIHFTYYKPHDWAPAYRIELKSTVAEDPSALAIVLQGIADQVVSPEIREPYPQYLADMVAKSVGAGLAALRTAVLHDLSDTSAGEYLQLITQSYRTEA